MKDKVKAFPIMAQWVGFNFFYLPVNHSIRPEGKSSYSFYKLLKLAFDIIISFSNKPLRLTIQLGLIIVLISAFIGVYNLILYALGKITVPGFASIIISIWFLSGIIITLIGMLGVYIGKTFEQVKDRPIFIINHKMNFNDEE
jgi:dolichol-phosphate mannosyltransferase